MNALETLMKVGGLRDCRVVAGHQGMQNIVEYVTVMEVPDIIKWLKGKELLLTSLYAIKDDPQAQQVLIKDLYNKGTAALGIKTNRFVDVIPQVIIDEANKYNLPLLEIPEQVSYVDILVPAMNTIFNNKVVLQQDVEQANQLLNEISLNGQGIEQFIATLSFLTKNIVTIESELSYISLPALPFQAHPLNREQKKELILLKRPIRLLRKSEEGQIESIVTPILLDGKLCGYITCWGVTSKHLEVDLAILERASSLLAFEFLREKVKVDIQQQYKNEFLRDIFLSDLMSEKDIRERGARYNFSAETNYICVGIQLVKKDGQEANLDMELVNLWESAIHLLEPFAIVGFFRKTVYVLLPIEDAESETVLKKVTKIQNKLSQHISFPRQLKIGIGCYHPHLEGIRTSFREAEKALFLGKMIWTDRIIIHYNDLGVYRLIALTVDSVELKRFYDESIGKLVEHDKGNEMELIQTLRTYFRYNERLKDVANALFIHVNTLKYRMSKIEKVTGHSLNDSEGKLILHLGLKIQDFMSSDYRFR